MTSFEMPLKFQVEANLVLILFNSTLEDGEGTSVYSQT
jgi:hypothetical protein